MIESAPSISEPSKFSTGGVVRIFLHESTIDLHLAGLNDRWLRRLHTPRVHIMLKGSVILLGVDRSIYIKLCHQYNIIIVLDIALSLQTGLLNISYINAINIQ